MARNGRQSKEQVQNKIIFLEDQLVSLDHYLPETYDYLMAELDQQGLVLAEISVAEAFEQIDQEGQVEHVRQFSETSSRMHLAIE